MNFMNFVGNSKDGVRNSIPSAIHIIILQELKLFQDQIIKTFMNLLKNLENYQMNL